MADETVDYKVNIDTSNIANQLYQIKNQIDQTMATTTFRTSMPDMQAPGFSFPMGSIAQGFGQMREAMDTGSRMAIDQARNLVETGRLGYQKFTQDVQNIALSIPVGYPSLRTTNEMWAPDMTSWGPYKSLAGSMGFGYDEHMSLTKAEYMYHAGRRSSANALRDSGTALASVGGGLLGTAVGGAYGGTLGAMAGDWIGSQLVGGAARLGYGAFAATVGQDFDAAQNMRSWMNNVSWRSFGGGMGLETAGRLASEMVHLGRSEDLVGRRIGLRDVQESMKSFTEAGGFDATRTADQFVDKMRMVVGSIDEFKKVLKTTTDGAAAAISELSRLGIGGGTASGMRSTIQRIDAQAFTAGYTPGEMMQFGANTAESVRGTGVDAGSAYLGGMDTLAGVRGGMRQGAFDLAVVGQMGGAENMAATMNRQGYNWGLSSAGFTYFAAQDYYGDKSVARLGMYETMAGAVSQVGGSYDAFLRYKGSQARRVSEMSGEQMYLEKSRQMLQQAVTVSKMMGTTLDEDTWVGQAEMMYGMSDPEARTMWQNMFRKSSTQSAVLAAQQQNINRSQNGPGLLNTALDQFGNAVAESYPVQAASQLATDVNNGLIWGMRGLKNTWTRFAYGYEVNPTDNYSLIQAMRSPDAAKSWSEVRGIGSSAETDKKREELIAGILAENGDGISYSAVRAAQRLKPGEVARVYFPGGESNDPKSSLADAQRRMEGKTFADITAKEMGYTSDLVLSMKLKTDTAATMKQMEEVTYNKLLKSDEFRYKRASEIRDAARTLTADQAARIRDSGIDNDDTAWGTLLNEVATGVTKDSSYRATVEKVYGISLTSDIAKNRELLGRDFRSAATRQRLASVAPGEEQRAVQSEQEALDSLKSADEVNSAANWALLIPGIGVGMKAATYANRWLKETKVAEARRDIYSGASLDKVLEQDQLRIDMLKQSGATIDMTKGHLSEEDRKKADEMIGDKPEKATALSLQQMMQLMRNEGIFVRQGRGWR